MGFNFSANPPLSLYVHFPWCIRKCPYCDFNSHELKNNTDVDDYLQLLEHDLLRMLPYIWGRNIHSIFFGGGTPSLLTGKQVQQILSKLRALLPLNSQTEITLEANPSTVETDNFIAYQQAGINRLSLGVQSFDNTMLTNIGRTHSADESKKAVEIALKTRFDKVNVDLMYALPNQTDTQALSDLAQALELGVHHISHYQLTLEPNTIFYKQAPAKAQLSEEFDAKATALFTKFGFSQYEVSAFATTLQHQAKHNLNYWQYGDYIGIGAGAHSKITLVNEQSIVRFDNPRIPKVYRQAIIEPSTMQKKHIKLLADSFCYLEPKTVIFEFALNSLRLKHGVTLDTFEARTGLDRGYLLPYILKAQAQGLLSKEFNQFKANEKGWRYLNDLQALFLNSE